MANMFEHTGVPANDGALTGIHLSQIAENAYDAIASATATRKDLMEQIKDVATCTAVTSKEVTIGTNRIDISTGAGALVLDDYLQELSTIEQAAAQFVAAENKAQKQVHSVTGQG